MWIYSSLKWDTTASWTGATWQKLFSTASKHTKCSFSNSLTTYCTDGQIMCTTITQWQLLSYNSKSHSCWLLNYLMCWYINGLLWREKTRLLCCIIILDHPGPSWTAGPESVFKSWRKPLSFSVRSLTKLVQNRASWVWRWTVFIPLHSRKRLSLSHHSQKHSNTADIHPCCLVCHVRVPAWQHVANETDRWRMQRWREDGRHAEVVGERGMRDVHGGHTPTWWQGERTRPIHSEWK